MNDPTDAEIIEWIGRQLRRGNLKWGGDMLAVGDTAFYGSVPDFPLIDFKGACIAAMRSESTSGEASER